jgi:hypothetical protein
VTVIYRKSDKLVAGWVRPPHSVEKEIENITNSELGGVKEDYATVTVTNAAWKTKGDKRVSVNEAGRVVFVPDPRREAKKAAKHSARAKLKGKGLSDEELDVLFERQ